ncbi:MAG: FkbM family methyltransferase [Solirubrobacterales bacterium]
MKQIGGIRLILPAFLQKAPEYPEYVGLEDEFLRSLELERQTVYDVGAFQGIFTLFFARKVGPEGHVVAFEPYPINYQRVVENVGINHLDNVTIRHVGVGRVTGELEFVAPIGGLAGRASASREIQGEIESTGLKTQSFSVHVVSLDDEIKQSSLPTPDLVKIDVEGLEFDVLQGMKETIGEHKPALFIEIHGSGAEAKQVNAERVVSFVASHGYEMWHIESGQAVDESTASKAAEGHLYCT